MSKKHHKICPYCECESDLDMEVLCSKKGNVCFKHFFWETKFEDCKIFKAEQKIELLNEIEKI
jgi:hypothetical protein